MSVGEMFFGQMTGNHFLLVNVRQQRKKQTSSVGTDVTKLSLRNLRFFVISQSVCPWQVLHSRVGTQPYPQTLDQAGKACQGQTLQPITTNPEITEVKSFIGLAPDVIILFLASFTQISASPQSKYIGLSLILTKIMTKKFFNIGLT